MSAEGEQAEHSVFVGPEQAEQFGWQAVQILVVVSPYSPTRHVAVQLVEPDSLKFGAGQRAQSDCKGPVQLEHEL